MAKNHNIILWLGIITLILYGSASAIPIHDIQYTTSSSGDSPMNGSAVTVTGVVTAVIMKGDTARYFMQDAALPWSGIYIYEKAVRNPRPEVGDSISVSGTVTEYYGMTEISTSSGGYYELLKKGCQIPQALVVPASYIRTGSPQAEAYEDMRVEVRNVRVVTSPNSYNEWSITDGGDTCWVNDLCASFAALGYTPVAGDTLYAVKGVVDYAYSVFKIEPVQLGDIIKYTNPVVVDGFPAKYSNNVSTHTVIRAVFNKPVDTTTVNAASFTVNGRRVFSYPPDSIVADPTRTIFTYYIHDTLMLKDTITVALRTGIRDSAGYSLMGIFTWVFYTSTPLVVKSSIPAEGNTMVPRGISPNLIFNNPLDPVSVTSDKFAMVREDSSIVPVVVTYDSTKNACYLQPSADFAAGETVRLWISHLLRDTIGQTLDGNRDGVAQDSPSDDMSISFMTISGAIQLDQLQLPDSLGYDSRYNGQTVTVEGLITSPSSTGSTYIQDSKGGANIYYSGASFNLGQRLVITGTVLEYNGTTEITSLSSINNWGYAATLPQPKTLIYNQFPTEQIEGILVNFDGIISSPPSYAGGGYNMNIRNGESPIAIRFSESAGFDISKLKLGSKVQVTGVVSQYDNSAPYSSGYQIITRFSDDYIYNGVNHKSDIFFLSDSVLPSNSAQITTIEKNPFSPDLGEVASIEINAPATDHLTLRIYDLKGRLVKTLLNNALGGHQIIPWDGTDQSHRRANIGIHIVHLRSVAADGKTTDQTKLLVMGTNLK